jgi:hypothetical protein
MSNNTVNISNNTVNMSNNTVNMSNNTVNISNNKANNRKLSSSSYKNIKLSIFAQQNNNNT